ncbi:MAG: group II intron reverse transcriptase/maturase [Rhodospirillales bacterium]|nr:group II intron reverse transcriptase/maturase [Rhodospirillales bacterium]
MTKTPIGLQELQRRIYVKAKAEPTWRFWGLFVHVCKLETLHVAYKRAKANDGAPGIDGVTFETIEAAGVAGFLEQLRDELVTGRYQPMRNRRKEIPKDGGKVRVLGIPGIRDRVVQGALKLILEPIFEADFQPGSYGYRPRRSAHEAVERVARAIVLGKTLVIDVDLRAYFDNVRHHVLLWKVARRVDDDEVMRLLKQILKASGERGVPQGGVLSPVLSNLYLNEVDQMLERAREVTRGKQRTYVEYARYADDLVVLADPTRGHEWLRGALPKRLGEEFGKLEVEVNQDKSRVVDLTKGESFGFLGFEYRRVKARSGKWRPQYMPKLKKRTELLGELREVFRRNVSQPVVRVIGKINPMLRGWVMYFRVGNSARCFGIIRRWVEQKVRRHMMRSKGRKGFGWKRWSSQWLYGRLGLFDNYRVVYYRATSQSAPS